MITLSEKQFARVQELAMRSAPPEVMNVAELALYLGVSEDVVRAKTQEGEIPHKAVGKRILYYREMIRAWLAGGRRFS